MLRLIDVDALASLVHKLEEQRKPPLLWSEANSSYDVITSLGDETTLFGRMMPTIDQITLFHDIIVKGGKPQQAMIQLGKLVLQHAFDCDSSEFIMVLGLHVTVKGGKAAPKFWSRQALANRETNNQNTSQFMRDIKMQQSL